MTEEASTAAAEWTRAGRVLPLNSRRLTAAIIKRIARALELPESAALDDVRQMVDGTPTERGEEPKSVQVALIDTDGGVVIELRNEDGTFLEVEPVPDTDAEIAERTGSEGARGSTPPPRLTDGTDARESEYREEPLLSLSGNLFAMRIISQKLAVCWMLL
jgi:hypothetical protein